MVLSAKSKRRSEGWGMGFFLVFFPEEEQEEEKNNRTTTVTAAAAINTLLRRTNSNHHNNHNIFTKAQSTISICALLIFLSLLIFTLSTLDFEPPAFNNSLPNPYHYNKNHKKPFNNYSTTSSRALQGMGTLYTRGTEAMNDLIICHLSDEQHELNLTVNEIRLFLRLFQRSGLPSRSDLLFIFPNSIPSLEFEAAIRDETNSFLRLVHRFQQGGLNSAEASFDVTQLLKSSGKKENPIWGSTRLIKLSNLSSSSSGDVSELTRPSYGSVVGFTVGELDPENSLGGFLDDVPMSLRRWACYPMLLGRLRRNFKHVALVDIKRVLLLGDPLERIRNRSPESVYLSITTTSTATKHGGGRKNWEKATHQKQVNSGIILGGARGVRRLCNAMLTDIVRAAMQQQHHKRKNTVTESALLTQLVSNQLSLKSINLVTSTESIPDLSSLSVPFLSSSSSTSYPAVRRGNSNSNNHNIDSIDASVRKHICSFPLDSSVYSDC